MTLQNRVTPTAEIVADPARGLLMGNRGCLHGPDRRLGASRWRSKSWICCVLDWEGVRRDPMPPGRWTALFFLDEATALAAGHRPCAYCRRAEFTAFAEGWRRTHGLAERPRAPQIDATLHAERVDPRTRRQLTRPAVAGALPDGVMVRHRGEVGLLAGGHVLAWSPAGYQAAVALAAATEVELLTPPTTAATIAAGYRPLLHPSAEAVHGLRSPWQAPRSGCRSRREAVAVGVGDRLGAVARADLGEQGGRRAAGLPAPVPLGAPAAQAAARRQARLATQGPGAPRPRQALCPRLVPCGRT